MARIRTIKPDFFRHEGLQDLATEHGAHVMLVFAGLWGHCDKAGRFEWRPRQLKLDILPFLDFDMGETLQILADAQQVARYSVRGKEYGVITSFPDHQRLSGKELQEPERFPAPPCDEQGSNREATGKQQGSSGDQQESQEVEGNGEEERNGVNRAPEKPARFDSRAELAKLSVTDPVLSDWLTLRKQKRAPVTETVIRGISNEASKAGITMHDALAICCRQGWQGFKAEWIKEHTNGKNGSSGRRADRIADTIATLTGANRRTEVIDCGSADRVD